MNTNTPGCDDPLYDNHVRQPGICGYINLTTKRCNN